MVKHSLDKAGSEGSIPSGSTICIRDLCGHLKKHHRYGFGCFMCVCPGFESVVKSVVENG